MSYEGMGGARWPRPIPFGLSDGCHEDDSVYQAAELDGLMFNYALRVAKSLALPAQTSSQQHGVSNFVIGDRGGRILPFRPLLLALPLVDSELPAGLDHALKASQLQPLVVDPPDQGSGIIRIGLVVEV